MSKTLKIFIYRYSYTSTLHALWICSLESKYLHLRAAGERRTKLIFDRLELRLFFFIFIFFKSQIGRRVIDSPPLSRFTVSIVHRNCSRNVRETISRGHNWGRERRGAGGGCGSGREGAGQKGGESVVPSPADAPAVLVTAFWQKKGAIVYVQFVVCNVSALSRSRRDRSKRARQKVSRVIGMYFACMRMYVCVCVSGSA